MTRDVDIVVVGAGVAGCATARVLARDGRGVVLLERFSPAGRRGSSHGASRIFRLNYPDERYVRLAQAAAAGWRELESECGEVLQLRTGVLDLGPVALDNARALAACGARFEELDGREVTRRFGIAADPDEPALFQPDGGTTLADRACAAFLTGAQAAGADLIEACEVTDVVQERGRVRVESDVGTILARAVVVTAGAWAPGLLARAGIELSVVPTRETVAYLALDGVESLPPVIDYGRVPVPGTAGLARAGQAGFALAAPGTGLKAGLHHAGPVTSPDDDPPPDETIAAWAAEWARSRFPLAGATLGAETCIYTNTVDESLVLERHGRIVVGSACSGHGFKFAPTVGRTLAALAAEAAR